MVFHGNNIMVTPNPDYATLGLNPNTITAPELDNLIQDTLNLIEVQL
jgi:hypothetical protein